jgi:hypothetical protein
MTVAGVLPALQAVYGTTTLSLGGHKPGQMLYCLYEVRTDIKYLNSTNIKCLSIHTSNRKISEYPYE